MHDQGVVDEAGELRAAATSGLMALTGRSAGPPLSPPAGLVRGLHRLSSAITGWSAEIGNRVQVDWADLLMARAPLGGLRRQGSISANGSCRLLRGPDGWMAVNLPRLEDRAAVEAIVEGDAGPDPWHALQQALDRASVAEMTERARLLGVPAAPLATVTDITTSRAPWSAQRLWPAAGRRRMHDLRVVDLSSMWAGPLAASLLSRVGARVVKVESSSRPDGARAVPEFYATLHDDDQQVVTLDFATDHGRERLGELIEEADVVVESSRPRALEQLGAGPDTVAGPEGKVWVSITGYGRSQPGADWVAFGDDAAVAGGLVAWEDAEHPVFCGDAVADPITGMVAAAAVLEAIAGGGGVLLDVSMQACAASVLEATGPVPATPARPAGGQWHVVVNGQDVAVWDRAARAQPERWTTRPPTTVAATSGS